MNRKKLIESGGHIDVAYGTFDRPGPDTTNEILPDLEPVTPSAQVANQLTLERPPVDDEDYFPTADRDLQLSLIELSKMIPSEKMKSFYKKIYNTVMDMSDKANKNGDKKMNNEAKKAIAKMIMEAIAPTRKQTKVYTERDLTKIMGVNPTRFSKSGRAQNRISSLLSTLNDSKFLAKDRTEAGNIIQKHVDVICANSEEEDLDPIRITNDILDSLDFPDEDDEPTVEDPNEREMTHAEIAPTFGYGASGINNILYGISYKMFITSQAAKFQESLKFFMNEYIEILKALDLIDEKEFQDMKKNITAKDSRNRNQKTVVEDLPSFRTFFSDLVIKPALKEFSEKEKNKAMKDLQKSYLALGVSKFSKDTTITLTNQITGVTPLKFKRINTQLDKDVENGVLDKQAKDKLVLELPKKIIKLHEDFIETVESDFIPFMTKYYNKNQSTVKRKIFNNFTETEKDKFSTGLNPHLSPDLEPLE